MSVKTAFEHYIQSENELEAFAEWAFGPYYRELSQEISFMECWNTLHKELLELKPDGAIEEDAPKMVELWKAHREEAQDEQG